MPALDGTGPLGQGPMTGRAAGYCVGTGAPGAMNPVPRTGFLGRILPGMFAPTAYGRGAGRGTGRLGRGLGRGRGRGFGRGGGRGRGW